MKKIYRTFQELVDANKGLFSVVTKTNQLGTYEAVWNSRQSEIDALKAELEAAVSVSKKLEEDKNFLKNENKIIQLKNQEIQRFSNALDKKTEEYAALHKKYESILIEHNDMKKSVKKQNLIVQNFLNEKELLNAQIDQLEGTIELMGYEKEESKQLIKSLHQEKRVLLDDNDDFERAVNNYKHNEKVLIHKVKEAKKENVELSGQLERVSIENTAFKRELSAAHEKIGMLESLVKKVQNIFQDEYPLRKKTKRTRELESSH